MNTKMIHAMLAFGILAIGNFAMASDDHDKKVVIHEDAHENEGGPNGGRLIEKDSLKCEFLLTDDRMIEVRFLNDHGDVLAPEEQTVTVIGGDREKPTRLNFSVLGDAWVSQQAFPEGNSLPVILEVKSSPDSPVVRERFRLSLGACPSCSYQEYACICGH